MKEVAKGSGCGTRIVHDTVEQTCIERHKEIDRSTLCFNFLGMAILVFLLWNLLRGLTKISVDAKKDRDDHAERMREYYNIKETK